MLPDAQELNSLFNFHLSHLIVSFESWNSISTPHLLISCEEQITHHLAHRSLEIGKAPVDVMKGYCPEILDSEPAATSEWDLGYLA